ncbi:DNA/RNA non-specific endonuclease [uncultured Acinetobacter sp.]|uniref:DNA/RNA non-specific endonuclease n=1 Tax=uncultured Acinetobacter sp. TaxID=165433 RepID=UPI00261DEC95|nr:DNA/RNA non-specific endonuclease [uncultured Acinetobacter sp.]
MNNLSYLMLGFTLAVGIFQYSHASYPCLDQFYQETAPQLQRDSLKKDTTALCLNGFNAMHSGISKSSFWVAEYLTPQRLSTKIPRNDNFHEEELVQGARATLKDYRGSGYDRGGLAPNADMPTKAAQHDSFSLANMVPQTPQNNQQVWLAIEQGVRALVTKQQRALYVITGPEYSGKNIKTIGNGKVLVPTATYKAIYAPQSGVIGAYYVSNDMNEPKPQVELLSICALEEKIGINLFPTLKDSEKRKIYNLPLKASNVKANQAISLNTTDTKSKCAASVAQKDILATQQLFKASASYEGTMAEVLAKIEAQPQAQQANEPQPQSTESSGLLKIIMEIVQFLLQLFK